MLPLCSLASRQTQSVQALKPGSLVVRCEQKEKEVLRKRWRMGGQSAEAKEVEKEEGLRKGKRSNERNGTDN